MNHQSTTETFNTTHGLDVLVETLVTGEAPTETLTPKAIYVPGVLMAALKETGESEFHFYIPDAQGNVIALSDAFGEITRVYQNDAWGNPLITTATNILGICSTLVVQEDLPNPYQWNGAHGYYYDEDVGMYLLGLRWYEPFTGRFLTPDPIGFSGDGINLYRYVVNNPVNAIDSLGLNGTGNTLNPLSPPERVELRRDENGNLILAPAIEPYASGFRLSEWEGGVFPVPQYSHGRTFSNFGNLTGTPVFPQPVDMRNEVWPYIRGTLFIVGGVTLMIGGIVIICYSAGVASGPGLSAFSAGVAWFHGGVAIFFFGFSMAATADMPPPALYPHKFLWHPMAPSP